jgi:hypothetical protein
MNAPTRREFLATTGVSVAAVGAAALAPAAFAGKQTEEEASANGLDVSAGTADGQLVAYVHDVSTGELSVMVGEHEVTVVDRALAARIARLSRAEV